MKTNRQSLNIFDDFDTEQKQKKSYRQNALPEIGTARLSKQKLFSRDPTLRGICQQMHIFTNSKYCANNKNHRYLDF